MPLNKIIVFMLYIMLYILSQEYKLLLEDHEHFIIYLLMPLFQLENIW